MMDRETIKSMASRMMDRESMRNLASRAGLYQPPPNTFGREMAILTAGFGMGALLMYMLDPAQGRRRRALARDQVSHFVTEAEKKMEAKARHWSNRARGVVAETKSAVAGGDGDVGDNQPF
jgi:hypothetical protein